MKYFLEISKNRLLCGVLSLLLGIVGWGNGAVYAEETLPEAASYVLLEADTATVLAESDSEKMVSLGSMAKLMTAYMVGQKLEEGEWTPETVLAADSAVADATGAVIWLVPGENMTVSDLLKGLIIGNANDGAIALAAAYSGSVAQFVMDMNAWAVTLGMKNTWFTSPQGDDSLGQYTTAYDLGLLCCALAQCESLTPYFQTWRDFLRGEATELVNENTLTRTDDTNIGFKASHSAESGWSIAAGAERGEMKCVAVVLGSTEEGRFSLAKSLLRQGFAGWKLVQPMVSAEQLYPVQVQGGVSASVLAEPGNMEGIVVPKACSELETVLVLPNFVTAPVEQGQKLGEIAFYAGDTLVYESTIVAAQSVPCRRFWDSLVQIVVKVMKI